MFTDQHTSEGSRSLNRSYPPETSVWSSHVATSYQEHLPPTNGGFLPLTAPPSPAHPGPGLQGIFMDELSRLQAQVQLNTEALETQRRSFDNLTQAVNRLSTCSGARDAVLENFADSIAGLESKVSEVDAFRRQLKIVKRRVRIMEEMTQTTVCPPNGAAPSRLSSSIGSTLETSQTHPPHPMQRDPSPGHPLPLRSTQHQTPLTDASSRDSPQESHSGTQATQSSQRGADNGPTSVNASTKRQRSEGADNSMDKRSETLESQKRLKLTPVHTHFGPQSAPVSSPKRHDVVKTDRKDHDGETTGEQQRRVAVTHADFVRRKDDVMNPQDSPTVRHGSADHSQIAKAYADSKKTRWKPIRDTNGTLLRKDGTPDMRSSSNKKRALQGEVPIFF